MTSYIIKFIWKVIANPFFYSTAVAVVAGLSSYSLALRRFHRKKQYQNKLDRYLTIVNEMKGFVEGAGNLKGRKKFTDCYRTIWLYGSSDVIKLLTKFLSIGLMKKEKRLALNSNELDKAKDQAAHYLKDAVLAMRKDLKARGKLKKEDFDIYV